MFKNPKEINAKTMICKTNTRFYGILIAFGILAMGFSSQAAYGEVLYGNNGETVILVAFDGDLSYINYKSTQGISEYFDLTLKEFKHGGFFLKAPPMNPGIVVFGHPQVNEKYTLVVMTSNGFERFIVSPLMDMSTATEIKDDTPEDVKSESDKILEAFRKNTENTVVRDVDAEKGAFELGARITENKSFQVDDSYRIVVDVYDDNQYTDVEDAQIKLELTRADTLMWVGTGTTSREGSFSTSFKLPFPEFYPTFCYEVKITIQKDEQTIYRYDDFVVYTSISGWSADDDHISTYTDYTCNEKDTGRQTTTRDEPFR